MDRPRGAVAARAHPEGSPTSSPSSGSLAWSPLHSSGMAPSVPTRCPVCTTTLSDGRRHDYGNRTYFNCPKCGLFGLPLLVESALPELLTSPRKASVLSYAIRRTPPKGRDTNLFDDLTVKKIFEADYLPTPQEQSEKLIRWLGENLAAPGEVVRLTTSEHGSIIGAETDAGLDFVVIGLLTSRLVQGNLPTTGVAEVTLSFEGWERFEQLRRGTPMGARRSWRCSTAI